MTQSITEIKSVFACEQICAKILCVLAEDDKNETYPYCPVTVEFDSRHDRLFSAYTHHPDTVTPRGWNAGG
jgi:hypothetical protein